MSEGMRRREFSREFKFEAVRRMEAGENVSALSRELTVKREVLYRWRDQVRRGGKLALRGRLGRPTQEEALALERARGPAAEAESLAQARRKIARLERMVGQQQLDLDFFREALRHVEAMTPGGPASSPASK